MNFRRPLRIIRKESFAKSLAQLSLAHRRLLISVGEDRKVKQFFRITVCRGRREFLSNACESFMQILSISTRLERLVDDGCAPFGNDFIRLRPN